MTVQIPDECKSPIDYHDWWKRIFELEETRMGGQKLDTLTLHSTKLLDSIDTPTQFIEAYETDKDLRIAVAMTDGLIDPDDYVTSLTMPRPKPKHGPGETEFFLTYMMKDMDIFPGHLMDVDDYVKRMHNILPDSAIPLLDYKFQFYGCEYRLVTNGHFAPFTFTFESRTRYRGVKNGEIVYKDQDVYATQIHPKWRLFLLKMN